MYETNAKQCERENKISGLSAQWEYQSGLNVRIITTTTKTQMNIIKSET